MKTIPKQSRGYRTKKDRYVLFCKHFFCLFDDLDDDTYTLASNIQTDLTLDKIVFEFSLNTLQRVDYILYNEC